MTTYTLPKTKLCKDACGLVKLWEEFNCSRGYDGKHKYCVVCHRLRHQSLCLAAKREGYSGREAWRKAVPKAIRMPIVEAVFRELVDEYLVSIGLPKRFNQIPHKKAVGKKVVAKTRPAPILSFDLISNESKAKLSEVKVKHREELSQLDNKQCTLKEGFVYVISNPAWPKALKIGGTLDYENRTNTYQTYDPYRQYKIEAAWYFPDRKKSEQDIQYLLDSKRIYDEGEWFEISLQEATLVVEQYNRSQNATQN